MTFPQTPLDVTVEQNLGGTWTDIKGFVFDRDGSGSIQFERGRANWAAQTERGTARMTLDNADGRFTPSNPMSPYYGLIGRNTELRIGLNHGDVFLDLPGADGDEATAPDASALGITGDIDIRIDVTMSNWRATTDLANKHVVSGDQRSWLLYLDRTGAVRLAWSTAGTAGTAIEVVSTLPAPEHPGRLAIRATLDVNNGASGNTARFYTAPTISGPWTQLGDAVVTAGTTSIHDGTAGLEVGSGNGTGDPAPVSGRVHAFELRSGINGTVVANPDFTAQAAGATSFADTASSPNTWTVAGEASITNRHWRFHGEVSEWPTSWEASGNDVWTQIEASGILRRLAQGSSPLRSTMNRSLTKLATPAVAYWPCEDAEGSTTIASGIGGTPMVLSGSTTMATNTDFKASAPLPALGDSAARWRGEVPRYTGTGAVQVRFLCKVPSGGSTTGRGLVTINTGGGDVDHWNLVYGSGSNGTLQLQAFDSDGATIADTGAIAFAVNGKLLRISVELGQNGPDIDFNVKTLEPGATSGLIGSGTLSSRTISTCTRVQVAPHGGHADVVFGHISVQSQITNLFDLGSTLNAHIAETAGRRFERLCREEAIPFRSIGNLDDTAPMGAQSPETLAMLLQECVDADLGIMYEPREVFGLGYRTRASLYNQPARIGLDYAAEHLSGPLDPVDDDQLTRNDITVTRKGGSSYRVEVTDGPLSVQKPEDGGVGPYPDTPTVNLEADTDLPDHTGWRAHIGTTKDARYPSLQVNLASDPVAADSDLTGALLDFEFGDRVTVTNPPAWLPPDQISQVVQGYGESMRQFEHKMTLTATPASPYRIGVYDNTELGRGESDGSSLTASVGSIPAVAFVADAETNNTVAGTSCVVNVPAGTARNDVMVALVGKVDQAAITPPAGWTLIGSQLAGSNVVYEAYYRVATAAEPANYTWSWTGSFKNAGWIGSYRNADVTAPIIGSASTGTSTPGTAFSTPVPAVTVPQGGAIIRAVFERHAATGAANTWTISSGTERMDAGSNGGSGQDDSLAVYDAVLNAAATPAVRTVTASQTVSQVALWTIALEPHPTTMEISVATPSGPLWTTHADSFPFDVMIGGERMTVEDAPGGLLDTFTRTVVDDWGTSDSGDVWVTSGGPATAFSVNGSSGLVTLNTVNLRHFVTTSAGSDITIYDSVTVPVTATGASISGGYVARYADDQNFYLYQILHDTGGLIDLQIVKRVAGVFTTIGSSSNIIAYTPGVSTHVRCLCSGSTLAVKIWADGDTEPADYQLSVTDTQFTSGQVGTHSTLLTSNTNTLPVVVTYDNIRVVSAGITGTTSPQAWKVVRSVNGVVKSHSSGADVTLFQPEYYAL